MLKIAEIQEAELETGLNMIETGLNMSKWVVCRSFETKGHAVHVALCLVSRQELEGKCPGRDPALALSSVFCT